MQNELFRADAVQTVNVCDDVIEYNPVLIQYIILGIENCSTQRNSHKRTH